MGSYKTTKENFALTVETNTGHLTGMPFYLVPGCISVTDTPKVFEKLTDTEAILDCENKLYITKFEFSRINARITSTHFEKKTSSMM